ncbi:MULTISPECIES: cytochrome c family protein [Rhodobacterales]|uniref:c-type cytochrome n=1 Tax=Rhodobacterales TaxID=204455 RepID=UPI003296DF7E
MWMNPAPFLMTSVVCLGAAAFAEGDLDAGEKVFRKCKACHAIGPDAKTKTGPVLTGILGAKAGSDPDFPYSKALVAAASKGLVWDEASLSAFLTKPRDFLEGTQMSFSGLRREKDVVNLIAYLASFD